MRRGSSSQLDRAIALLEQHYPAWTGRHEQTVHEVRKSLKRLRALMRLLRGELGRKRYARENAALRDCGRRLAGARDAEVMVGTLDALVRAPPRQLAASSAGRRRVALRAELVAERERAASAPASPRGARRYSPSCARCARGSSRGSCASVRASGQAAGPGLERLYRQGARACAGARRRGDADAMHALAQNA